MTREQAIAKARKLLNLASHENTNENEAALAAAQAQRIMLEHDIAEAAMNLELPDEPVQFHESEELEPFPEEWRSDLTRRLAVVNGCICYTKRDTGDTIFLCGTASRVSTVRYVYAYCARSIMVLSFKRTKEKRGKVWLRSYQAGMIDAIIDKICQEQRAAIASARAAAQDEVGRNPRALIVVDKAIAKVDANSEYQRVMDFMRRNGFRFRSAETRATNIDARQAGRRDGANIYGGSNQPGIGGGQRRLGSGS